jgi:DNA repair exonuclease SbcCD ATPase subunit
MKKDKILEAYEEMLNELYGTSGRAVGISRSGSKGQRASNVALTCPQCGELDHSHEGLEKGAKCPVCGQIVEEKKIPVKVTATWKKGALTWASGKMKRVSSGPRWRDKAPSEKEVKKHLEKILKKEITLDYKVVGK